MTGKVDVITGTTADTRYVCAKEVANKGASVMMLNRQSEQLYLSIMTKSL